jgi:ribosome-binding protein aMBF1 (putative translation factor)
MSRIGDDELYSKKLEALVVELKSIMYGDIPFATSADYACKFCQGRIKLHTHDGKWYCLRCALRPGAIAPRWSKVTREHVEAIMAGYPEEVVRITTKITRQERITYHDRTIENVAFGARIEEARQALGWTQEELALRILKKHGKQPVAISTIHSIERGIHHPSEHLREQLEVVLGLKEAIS